MYMATKWMNKWITILVLKKISDMTKDIQWCRLVHFLLVIDCWDCRPPLRVVCFSSETPLDKAGFSFASSYQLYIASELRMLAASNCRPCTGFLVSKGVSQSEPHTQKKTVLVIMGLVLCACSLCLPISGMNFFFHFQDLNTPPTISVVFEMSPQKERKKNIPMLKTL